MMGRINDSSPWCSRVSRSESLTVAILVTDSDIGPAMARAFKDITYKAENIRFSTKKVACYLFFV